MQVQERASGPPKQKVHTQPMRKEAHARCDASGRSSDQIPVGPKSQFVVLPRKQQIDRMDCHVFVSL